MKQIIRKWITTKDQLQRLIWGAATGLFCIGLFFLFYAYVAEATKAVTTNIFHSLGIQAVAFATGLFVMYLVSRIRYQIYRKFIFFISGFAVITMLTLITPLAVERNGAIRWIDLGITQFQPSEVMKIALVLLFAFIFTHKAVRENVKKLITYSMLGFFALMLASVLQPDYGTVAIVGSAIMGMALIAQLPKAWWFTIIGSVVVMAVGVGVFAPSYLTNRFEVFYDVNFGEITAEERYGEAYHALQNLEAVRVGGLFGQGPGYVAQSTHLNIPELTTDSTFALIAAETGFIGSVTLITCFLLFFMLCYTIADFTKDPFGKYIVVGITTLLAAQFFVNILVVLGFPATGIPLIFISRGGSSLLITLAAVGIILNVLRQQPMQREIYRGPLS